MGSLGARRLVAGGRGRSVEDVDVGVLRGMTSWPVGLRGICGLESATVSVVSTYTVWAHWQGAPHAMSAYMRVCVFCSRLIHTPMTLCVYFALTCTDQLPLQNHNRIRIVSRMRPPARPCRILLRPAPRPRTRPHRSPPPSPRHRRRPRPCRTPRSRKQAPRQGPHRQHLHHPRRRRRSA